MSGLRQQADEDGVLICSHRLALFGDLVSSHRIPTSKFDNDSINEDSDKPKIRDANDDETLVDGASSEDTVFSEPANDIARQIVHSKKDKIWTA